jgi:hypothetical protein
MATKDIVDNERAFAARYPNLYRELMALGPTNAARARALDVSLRQFHDIKQGLVSIKASRLERLPRLARAWYNDAIALPHVDQAA